MRPQNTSDIRSEILRELRAVGCDHTSELAYMVGCARSTARRHLDQLEVEGLVSGTKHDERNTGGRIRIYWSLTPEGEAVAE